MSTVREVPGSVCTNYALKENETLLSISIPTSKDPNGIGLIGIFTIPPSSLQSEEDLINSTTLDLNHAPTHKLAIILHGKGGHKNYCYQAMLAQDLAAKRGIYSFRFDFRGCGDSQANNILNDGRTVAEDVEDINTVIDVFEEGARYKEIGINLVLNSIISHSRGSVAMFIWAIEQQNRLERGQEYKFAPNLINTSGRFQSCNLITKQLRDSYLNQYRLGEYRDVLTTKKEIVDLASQDLAPIRYLDNKIQVLSVYGLNDTIVPVEDSADFANLLGSRHTLKFIKYADHNFHGIHDITEENSGRFNKGELPLKRGKVNYNYLVSQIIVDWLSSEEELIRNVESTKIISQTSRSKSIDGISNFRDIGGWKVKKDNNYVKSGLIFRCASTSNVTDYGKQQLLQLNVNQIFDLRSYREIAKAGEVKIPGVTLSIIPVFPDVDLSPQGMAQRFKHLICSWYTYKYVYLKMLREGGDAFKSILLYLRDNPDTPIVYNCTAGKDRTGVATMIILLVLGVDKHTIAKEYELTAVGLLPDIPRLKVEYYNALEKLKASLASESMENENLLAVLRLDPEEMLKNLLSSKYESMIATIALLDETFGGIENYCLNHLGLSSEDLETIRNNLLTTVSPLPDQNSAWAHRNRSGNVL